MCGNFFTFCHIFCHVAPYFIRLYREKNLGSGALGTVTKYHRVVTKNVTKRQNFIIYQNNSICWSDANEFRPLYAFNVLIMIKTR